jgi:hypothetical protein
MTTNGVDRRRAGRWGWLLAFMLLPWLFVSFYGQALQNGPNWCAPGPGAVECYDGAPVTVPVRIYARVPTWAPVAVQYTPMPIPTMQRWIDAHYPGNAMTPGILTAADTAAHGANLSVTILLGILAAEQSFLDTPDHTHNVLFQENPWDYGVYPGSPFPFAIGPLASAKGAASIVASVARVVFVRGAKDTKALLGAFASILSGIYVNGQADFPDMAWARTVFGVALSLVQAGTASVFGWVTNAFGWLVHEITTNAKQFEANFSQAVAILSRHSIVQILSSPALRDALAVAVVGAVAYGAATMASAAGVAVAAAA